jgi:hypothetical protein
VTPEEISTALQFVQTGGVIGLLALAVYAGYKGLVVPRSWLDEIVPMIVAETIRQLRRRPQDDD